MFAAIRVRHLVTVVTVLFVVILSSLAGIAQLPPPPPTPRGCPVGGCASDDGDNSGGSPGGAIGDIIRLPGNIIRAHRGEKEREATELNIQGNAAYANKDWTAADAAYEKALGLNPNNRVIRGNLANAQTWEGEDAYRKGDYTKALSFFQQAIANHNPDFPDTHILREDIAAAQGKIDQAQKDKVDAKSVQQSIQDLAKTLNATPSTSELDFDDGKGAARGTAGGGSASKGLGSANSTASLNHAVKDSPSEGNVVRGLLGSKVANPGPSDLIPAGPAGVQGTNTKAGDELLSAAHSPDLRANYDGGGAKPAGSIEVPDKSSIDPATFSPKVRNDQRMMSALKQLDELNAKRTQLNTELERLTVARGVEKDPHKSEELTRQLNQKNGDVQDTLLSITKAEATVAKTKRTIETEVEAPKAVPERE